MIIDKTIIVKITKRNINHYLLYYNDIKLRDIISIEIVHLQKNSNKKVNVECDICGIHRYIMYQSYNNNISSCEEHKIYTCDKCSHIKLKSYNLKHYGVEYYSQHPDRNEKVKKTSIEKYGSEHFSKSIYFLPKVSKTNLEKFGYINPFMDNERIKRKFKDKYGVDHPSLVDVIKEKIKTTNINKYGVDNPLKSKLIREKINKTFISKYGGHYMKNEEFRNCLISRDKDYIKYVGGYISLFKCEHGHDFEISSDLYHNRLRSNLPLCTICYPLSENSSIKEIEIFKFIESIYSGNMIKSYRDVLEIDIYLPELKIGFEFNGLYWHSEIFKEKNYHLNKTNYFKEKGIRIIHIWEDDWDYKNEIIKSQISNIIGISNKVYARKCKIMEIGTKLSKVFINSNHIQGYLNSTKKYGLFYNGELISIMTFDKNEGRKKMKEGEWNLNRFCNKNNTSVIGGASRLLNFFIKNNIVNRIISYTDRDWSIGNLYEKLGFTKIHDTQPDYKYIIKDRRVHKSRYRKSNLNTTLSESSYMIGLGINKIYDCGKIKYEFSRTNLSPIV